MPGFEHSQLLYSAGEIGVRESRMIDGEYLLTETDLRDCVKFEDRIAAGNYDIDIHNPEGSGTSHYYFPAGTWYTICLLYTSRASMATASERPVRSGRGGSGWRGRRAAWACG